MKLVELHLKAFGPFTDQVLQFGSGMQNLVLVHGLNEAGKSTALRAIAGLRFGIPTRTPENYLHEYSQLRIGGVFLDSAGKSYSLMRRKGASNTLRFCDFTKGGVELSDPVPPTINQLLTGGLSVDDYESMFGLDHNVLRKGGQAIVEGKGDIGAALFEASSGTENVSRILDDLDAAAKRFFTPAAQGRNARINQALIEYKSQSEQYKTAQVKPTKWESIAKASQEARSALEAIQAELKIAMEQQQLLKELIAVEPILALHESASKIVEDLAAVVLLDENAAAERATADSGLSEANADISTNQAAVLEKQFVIDGIKIDPVVLTVAEAISRLHAAATTISQLRGTLAVAESDIASRKQLFAAAAAKIDSTVDAFELMKEAPAATGKARIEESIAALEDAERALSQHRLARPNQAAILDSEARAVPDEAGRAALRFALQEVVKSNATLQRLESLPNEIKNAERATNAALAATGLANEAAARRVVPILNAAIDNASQQVTAFASKRSEKITRVDEIKGGITKQQDTIKALRSEGNVPTHGDVREAREHRQKGWSLIKATYIVKGAKPDITIFAQERPLSDAYEEAVLGADKLVDDLAGNTERVAKLEAAERELGDLERDLNLRQGEVQEIDQDQRKFDTTWQATLAAANISPMPPAELRDWQHRLATALTALDLLQTKREDFQRSQDVEQALATKIRLAIGRLGMEKAEESEPLGSLVVIAEDCQTRITEILAASQKASGQALQFAEQQKVHSAQDARLVGNVTSANSDFAGHLPSVMLDATATMAMAKARLAEFDALSAANDSLAEAQGRGTAHAGNLAVYEKDARSIAAALSESPPEDMSLAAEIWSKRLQTTQRAEQDLKLAKQGLAAAEKALSENESKANRHRATLSRLCQTARVQGAAELPEAEERSNRKRQAMRDAAAAATQLARASRRNVDELRQLLAGRDHATLTSEELQAEHDFVGINERLEAARTAEELARSALSAITDSDAAASAADAMASALSTVRNTLPLQIRTRLAHALLKEAVRRFKDRSQAPMLKSASKYFAEITDREYEALINDDSGDMPAIAARRAGGTLVSVKALSEGTRDQLYLALRLAALDLQRERGVDLPATLDDVLMASDDIRAGCIFKALADFSKGGQVVIFTHHSHLCEVARKHVGPEALVVVELKRDSSPLAE